MGWPESDRRGGVVMTERFNRTATVQSGADTYSWNFTSERPITDDAVVRELADLGFGHLASWEVDIFDTPPPIEL